MTRLARICVIHNIVAQAFNTVLNTCVAASCTTCMASLADVIAVENGVTRAKSYTRSVVNKVISSVTCKSALLTIVVASCSIRMTSLTSIANKVSSWTCCQASVHLVRLQISKVAAGSALGVSRTVSFCTTSITSLTSIVGYLLPVTGPTIGITLPIQLIRIIQTALHAFSCFQNIVSTTICTCFWITTNISTSFACHVVLKDSHFG